MIAWIVLGIVGTYAYAGISGLTAGYLKTKTKWHPTNAADAAAVWPAILPGLCIWVLVQSIYRTWKVSQRTMMQRVEQKQLPEAKVVQR